LGGAESRLLFYNTWLYPFNSFEEWVNSDVLGTVDCPNTSGCWFKREQLGGSDWIYTNEDFYNNYDRMFYRYSDGSYLQLYASGPGILFFNQTTAIWEAYPGTLFDSSCFTSNNK